MKFLSQICGFIFISIALFGCETLPEQKPLPVISFARAAPLLLDVAQIEIQNNYKPLINKSLLATYSAQT